MSTQSTDGTYCVYNTGTQVLTQSIFETWNTVLRPIVASSAQAPFQTMEYLRVKFEAK